MGELVLYTNPASRGRITRWMLEEIGAPYRVDIISYGDEIRSADYRAINPMAKVPALKHGEVVVTETPAICAYLADAFPEAGLAPPPGARGAYYRWLFFAAGPLEAAITHRALGYEPPAERSVMIGYGNYDRVIDALAAHFAETDYIAGPVFTAADVYAGSQIGFGLLFGTIEKRPELLAYWKRLKDRPALLRARALDDAAMPADAQRKPDAG